MLLIALALALVGPSLALSPVDLNELCHGKDAGLSTISQFGQLARAMPQATCYEKIRYPVEDLLAMLEANMNDLCSEQSIKEFLSYYRDHLDTSVSYKRDRAIPRGLKMFGLAYGMQLSNLCKKHAVRVITGPGRQLLSGQNLAQLERVAGESGPVDRLMSVLGEPGDVYLAGDLASSKRIAYKSHQVEVQATTGRFVRDLQLLCRRQLRPIYGPSILRTHHLSNMGLNYRDGLLSATLKSGREAEELNKWSRIAYLCETLAAVEIVEEQGDRASSPGKKVVRILTEQQAQAAEGAKLEPESQLNIPHLDFNGGQPVQLGDVIYDAEDKRLVKAVREFKTDRDVEDVLLRRVFGMGLSEFARETKKGKLGKFLRGAAHGLTGRPIASPAELLVKALDKSIESHQVDPEALFVNKHKKSI